MSEIPILGPFGALSKVLPSVLEKGNRKVVSAGNRMTAQERKTYNKNFDRIFGKPQKNFNRQKG